jgi:glycosyltransferase involved in cell wall biosynthesis
MMPRKAPVPSIGDPLVSVIIPVRDDPVGIRQVLDCLNAQTVPKSLFEVIIGDDGSRPDLVPEAVSDERVRLVCGPPRTSYAARNMAVEASRGSILAFCDADCLPAPKWLEEGLAALEDADVVAGEVRFQAPAKPTVWSLLTIDLFLDQQQNASLSRGVTANLLVRRESFYETGGFDQSLPSGGDYDFVGRMAKRGARLRYSPLAIVGHPTMDRARSFLQKIFKTNFWSGVRHARDKDKIDLAGVLVFVPVIGVMIARRRSLRPAFRLHHERLKTSGVSCSRRDYILAVLALYCVVSFVAGAGRVLGWLRGLWLARQGCGPVYASLPGDTGTGKLGSGRHSA